MTFEEFIDTDEYQHIYRKLEYGPVDYLLEMLWDAAQREADIERDSNERENAENE